MNIPVYGGIHQKKEKKKKQHPRKKNAYVANTLV